MNLLLLSNSTAPGRRYLEHAHDVLAETLNGVSTVTFVPFALADHDGYTEMFSSALKPLGMDVVGAHTADPAALVAEAEAVFVGGGNTFRLVSALHRHGLITRIRDRVDRGMPYVGSSAGTNIAAPTLRTTNDMPIVQPPNFDTLGLVPFQINPHYVDPVPGDTHMGETREGRLIEFLEENDVPVVALREGTWLRRGGGTLTLAGGESGGRLFERGVNPAEIASGADLSRLLAMTPRFDA
ncbi:dipeptidase PepE [Phytoactinopolyspora limicola]|uniref:dipeptidase PepE n=1 Tax=Phytoactinopolyspora limicola TaxID=2715536 RepID=UPI00140C6E43|nr:dipeptidase PepE [Phytoactinopolyspora limicola]